MSSSIPGASSSMACDHRPLRDLDEYSASGVLHSDGGSSVSRHRHHDAVVGWHAGVCLPSLRPSASCAVKGSAVQGSGAHPCGSVLASTPLVSRPSGASGGCPSVPSTAEGSTQTASLPSLSPEPPRASADCVSYIERSARAFGFTSAVARQLARCRRHSTQVNYQAKWSVFRAWCRRHGHSVSGPTIPKIASFLLYLRRSLSLSYSSGVFRFVLPDLSSHFVLRDLLRSFRLERPVSSSRVPPWDLSRVLFFLREPLSSCCLRDLSRKVLFLVVLATARRVGELQALSAVVSESGDDLFLSYLPEFRAEAESESRPLPRSFCIRSLTDFVGDLPEELLLCPVRALRVYLSRTSSLPSRPRALFVSPRSPSRPLSKNALSFFLRDVIAEVYSSSGLSLPSTVSSASSSRPRSSVRAHGVRGIAASWAFHRNASLSSILEAATWSSASVFISFYLSDVQFSSSQGFGLGPVVAVGTVVECRVLGFLDRLSSGCSLLFQLGVSVLGGNTRPSSRVPVLGAPWVLPCSLESPGCAHSPLWQLKALGDRSLPSRRSRRTHARAFMHMSSSWLHSLPSMVFEDLG